MKPRQTNKKINVKGDKMVEIVIKVNKTRINLEPSKECMWKLHDFCIFTEGIQDISCIGCPHQEN